MYLFHLAVLCLCTKFQNSILIFRLFCSRFKFICHCAHPPPPLPFIVHCPTPNDPCFYRHTLLFYPLTFNVVDRSDTNVPSLSLPVMSYLDGVTLQSGGIIPSWIKEQLDGIFGGSAQVGLHIFLLD